MKTILTSLLICTATFLYSQTRTEKEAKILINEIHDKLLRRESGFMAAASEYSEDEKSAKNGGQCEIVKGTYSKKFDQIVFNLNIQESSGVFKSREGYNIVVLLEKTDTKAKIMRILIKYKH